MNQGRKEFLRTGVANEKTNHLYNIAWVIDILLQAIATKNFHSSTFVKVAMIITKHTPTRIKETFDGIKNVILIDNWLEQQTFGTQVDQYLAKLIFDNRHKENFSISDINKNLNTTLQHLYEQFLPETGLAVKQYIEQIVTREFPAFGYKNFRSQREVFQWGFSHIGYSFLPLASVYANQFSSEETYALGYNLYTLFKKGLLHTELVKIFIIPAMIFHTHHFRNNDLSTFTDFLNLESFQHSALKAYFNYNPEHDIVENAIRSFHTSFNKFIDFFLSPDETTNHTERRLDFRTRRNTLIERHIEADQTFITAALLALDPPTQDIIRKSVITFGTFTFSLPNEKTSNQDAIADIIYRATHQDFKAPPYIHIFKCLYKNRIEHIFALKQLETGYVIKKADQDVTLYRELLTDNDKHGYRHYTNLSLRFFSERDYIPKKLGLINLAKYFSDKHSAVLKESLYEFDWCGFDPEDVKQKLLSINQVPFHQCFTGIDGAQASLTLLQSSVNRVKNMIPYYRINTDWIDEMNDDVFLKRVVQRDALPAYAMSLAMNNSIQQAPLRDKSAHQAYDAAGPDEQQSITENAISGGLNEI